MMQSDKRPIHCHNNYSQHIGKKAKIESSLRGILHPSTTNDTHNKHQNVPKQFFRQPYPSSMPTYASNANVYSEFSKVSHETDTQSRNSHLFPSHSDPCRMERSPAYQEKNASYNALGAEVQNPFYYNYNYSVPSAPNQYHNQHFPMCDEPQHSYKPPIYPSASNSSSFLTEPLSMDYVNFKKYMEPNFPNRTPLASYSAFEDTNRLGVSHNSAHGRSMFFPSLQEQDSRFGYPQTTDANQFPSLSHPLFPPITPGAADIYGHQKPAPEDFHLPYGNMYPAAQQQPAEYCRPEAIIRVVTKLHPKYWRNGRRNLQCFPNCQAYGDYSLIRLENFKSHDFMWGKCRGRIEIEVSLLNTDAFIDDVVILCRIHSLDNLSSRFEEDVNLESMAGKTVKLKEMEEMKDLWIIGDRCTDRVGLKTAGFTFKPKVWKYVDNENPGKCKRRHIKYYVQLEAFILIEDMSQRSYLGIGSGASTSFEVGSSRVLARQKRKAASKSSETNADILAEELTPSAPQHPEASSTESQNFDIRAAVEESTTNTLDKFLSYPVDGRLLQNKVEPQPNSEPQSPSAGSQ